MAPGRSVVAGVARRAVLGILALGLVAASGRAPSPVTLEDVTAEEAGADLVISGVAAYVDADFEVASDPSGDAIAPVGGVLPGFDLRSATIVQSSSWPQRLEFILTLDGPPSDVRPGASWQWPMTSAEGCPTLVAAVDAVTDNFKFYVHHGYCRPEFRPDFVDGEVDGDRIIWRPKPAILRAPRGSVLEAHPSRPITANVAGVNLAEFGMTTDGLAVDTMAMTELHGIGGGVAIVLDDATVHYASYDSGEPFRFTVPDGRAATFVDVVAPYGPHEAWSRVR